MKVKKLILFSLVLIPMISFGALNNCDNDNGCPSGTYCLSKGVITNNSDQPWYVAYTVYTGGIDSKEFKFQVTRNKPIAIKYCAQQGPGSFSARIEVMDSDGKYGTTPLSIYGTAPNDWAKINNSSCIGNVAMNSPSDGSITINETGWCVNPPSCLIGNGVCPEGTGFLWHPRL